MSRRRVTDPDWKALADKLPIQPGPVTYEAIMSDAFDEGELGEEYMAFRRESITIEPPLKRTMLPEDWAAREAATVRTWGAVCHCTACGEGFVTRWREGGFTMTVGEDGMFYPDGSGLKMRFDIGDSITCPFCCRDVEVIQEKELRSGRSWQVLVPEIVKYMGYDAVVFWLVRRTIPDARTESQLIITPRDALVIDRCGKIRRMQYMADGWRPSATVRDPEQVTYYSWEAANHRAVGGWGFMDWPNALTGTGEKTALEVYADCGGVWPGRYLLLWQRHPNVENLMRNGMGYTITEAVDDPMRNVGYWSQLSDVPDIPWVDWQEKKPHRMLHVTKEEYRLLRKIRPDVSDMRVWRLCKDRWPTLRLEEFYCWVNAFGAKSVEKLLELCLAGWEDLTPWQVYAYLQKHHHADANHVQMLIDYRKTLAKSGLADTRETRWPKRLREAHDRTAEWVAARAQCRRDEKFAALAEKYKGLEWTDGELCVVIPRSEAELIMEGEVLRHCVGTYGDDHLKGKSIFFIRHYRRPERSYYTLNIDMTKPVPKEVQLHGYGNEHHGVNKEHRHSIPKEVRDFCDRWEREVLLPWVARKTEADSKTIKTGKKRRKTA